MHALLATGAVHQHLVRKGLRCDINLIIETGTARDPHHFACLIGFGATAVYPYLAYQTLHDLGVRGILLTKHGEVAQIGRSYRRGIKKGLLKIISKMGISTIGSYRGARLFEIVGLDNEVVELCFAGTPSRIGGADFEALQADAQRAGRARLGQQRAAGNRRPAAVRRTAANTTSSTRTWCRPCSARRQTGDPRDWTRYADAVEHAPAGGAARPAGAGHRQRARAIPLDEVEPASQPSCAASTPRR